MASGNKRKSGKPGKVRRNNQDYYKGRSRRDDRGDDVKEGRPNGGAYNDVSWYTRYPNLSVASAQFPFPYRPGMDLEVGTPTQKMPWYIPGTLEIGWYPSIGWSEKATDPASIVCKELFQKVRKAYGAGDLLADAPDFMVYLMALDSVFSYIATLRRIYRLLPAWTPNNYALPDNVLHAIGVNQPLVEVLRVNRSSFWQVINELTLMSRKFTCPAVMDIMNRHFWMNDNVYTDAATVSAQMYAFHQLGYYRYKEQMMPSGDPAAGLEMVASPFLRGDGTATTTTVQSIYDFGKGLIDALVAWDDAYTINGYLSRAFEGTPNFIVDEIPMDQPFNPVYEPEVLQQIENTRVNWAGDISLTSMAVSQDVLTNSIIHKPTVTFYAAGNPDRFLTTKYALQYMTPLLSQRSDNPSVADNIIASRLHMNYEAISDTTARVIAATEIPYRMNLWLDGSLYLDIPSIQAVEYATGASTDASKFNTFMMEAFDWHPITIIAQFAATSGKFNKVFICGDVHNVTTITSNDLKNMHKVCVYSEFNAFSIG